MLQVSLAVAGLILAIYALVDCARTAEDAVRGFPKIWWVTLIALVTVAGPLAWLIAGRPKKAPVLQQERPPIGPEDDPEFLRRLNDRGSSSA
jgi:hypothetical protein